MWKTIEYYQDGRPKIDVNEQGAVYSYKTKRLLENENNYILVAKAFPEICGEWFKGCHVHHKDFNHSNNEATNLICLSPREHVRIHKEAEELALKEIDEIKKLMSLSEKRVRFYCRESKINKTGKNKGKSPIEAAIYIDGKRLFKTTGKYGNPKTFNPKKFSL